MEVATYCKHNQASFSAAQSRPAPGAACCAQYSGEEHLIYIKIIQHKYKYILISILSLPTYK